jgi:uncharacterized membrane protein AbrB (regulator of aidB expression)
MRLHYILRFTLTLLLVLGAAALCVRLRTPLPWMIGPLVATALASVAGLATESSGPLRNTGQWIIGTALGLYFTPQVTALVASLWWAIGLAIVWALALGAGFRAWLHWVHAPRRIECPVELRLSAPAPDAARVRCNSPACPRLLPGWAS